MQLTKEKNHNIVTRNGKVCNATIQKLQKKYESCSTTARFVFMVFSRETIKSLGVFRHTVIKPQNACTTQLASAIAFKCHFSKPSKIGNKSFIVY